MGCGLLACALAFCIAGLLTPAVRGFVVARGLLDIPNARSSHAAATPRGGGIAIVVAVTLGAGVLTCFDLIAPRLFLTLLVGGMAVAAVGYLDDRHRLRARTRLLTHALAAVLAIVCLGGFAPVQLGTHVEALGWAGSLLALLGIVWVINLFNFMDGIDGIAAGEALFVAGAGALISQGAGQGVSISAWLLCGASAAFLVWNWPPARIFMGDAGSGYIGFVLAVLALGDSHRNAVAVWQWLILGGVFFVDATVTLVRRALRGESLSEAHRQHAYQWLARSQRSHAKVTLGVLATNLLWLLPCALYAGDHPSRAAWFVVVALGPLAVAALAAGAGRNESPGGTHA
jgi:Fuc2NAc and GlcNAc transferase